VYFKFCRKGVSSGNDAGMRCSPDNDAGKGAASEVLVQQSRVGDLL
jgi:hypothetical protein